MSFPYTISNGDALVTVKSIGIVTQNINGPSWPYMTIYVHDGHIWAKDVAPNDITVQEIWESQSVNESRKDVWYLNCFYCFAARDKSICIALGVSYFVDFVCSWFDALGSYLIYLVLNREICVLHEKVVYVLHGSVLLTASFLLW